MDFRQTSASCINFCPGLFFFTWHKDLSEKTCLGQASYQDILNVWMFLAFKPETGRTGGEATASYVLHIAKSEIPEQQRWTQVGYFSSLRSERYGTPLNKKQVKERQYLHEKNVNNYTDLYDMLLYLLLCKYLDAAAERKFYSSCWLVFWFASLNYLTLYIWKSLSKFFKSFGTTQISHAHPADLQWFSNVLLTSVAKSE